MTVKELMEELTFYDEDAEVVFEIDDDIECESWTENKWGNKEVHVRTKLENNFTGEIHGDCYIQLGVVKE